MTLEELFSKSCAWFVDHDPNEIAISSRIRLARNLDGIPFPAHAHADQRRELRSHVLDILKKNPKFQDGLFLELDDVPASEKWMLFERSLISKELAEENAQSGLAVSPDTQDVVMINEEDHLRLQVMRSGLSLEAAWEEIAAVDDAVEAAVNYAFSESCGYLTCCPSNTGTGMRAGVMLHLPGLVLMEEIRPVIRGLGKIGLAVRGLGGEGSDADGFLYQVSNQITLGRSEEDIIREIHDVVEELISHERNARIRLEQSKPAWLRDRVSRAMGILQNAWVLPSKEALDLLSMVRLGLATELLTLNRPHEVEQLMVEVRPAHLLRLAGKELSPEARDRFRAEWVRSKLADLQKGAKLKS
jgi:protein arginine kinase